jgi:histidinol dehydrogenase
MTILPTIEAGTPALARVMDRSTSFAPEVEAQVAAIVHAVRTRGDDAVREYTERFDRRSPVAGSYELARDEWERRAATVAQSVIAALEHAAARLRWFHGHQREADVDVRQGGVRLGLRVTPLARVGLYVPGGTALYPSSVLMTAVPAKVAGVGEVVMVTPGASAETLAAARLAGVDRVFEIGGAQAVAALAYGTATVPRVDKIVGPGNQWVAAAKRLVFGQVDIDSVAGPSEVLIIADEHADPVWVAADLIAQAEHDVEARPILVTTSAALAERVRAALEAQLATLPRAAIARASLATHGAAILVGSLDEAVAIANAYAPEHLEVDVADAAALVPRLTAAGAIFVGKWASEATGDYVAGANHVLPTGGAARYASPLGVHDYVRRTSIVEYDEAAARADAPLIAALADVEGLHGHGRSALVRVGVDPVTAVLRAGREDPGS